MLARTSTTAARAAGGTSPGGCCYGTSLAHLSVHRLWRKVPVARRRLREIRNLAADPLPVSCSNSEPNKCLVKGGLR